MSNKFKNTDIKNNTYYVFDDIINVKCFDPKNINMDELLKNQEDLWSKIRDLIRSITKNLDHYEKKYVKFKFNSNDYLPLNKTTIVQL